ncbi:MAG: helix-turn-helix domain-containing protein [Rhodospirillales bacterium]
MTVESRFSTKQLAPQQRFDVWRESIAVLYDVELDAGLPEEGFVADIHAYLYEDLMIARTRTSAQRYRRDGVRIAQDNVDHYMIQFFMKGSQRIRRGSRTIESSTGDLMVHDLASEHVAESSYFDNLSLIMPRRVLEPLLHNPDSQHGRLLPTAQPMARILSRHLQDLYDLAPRLDAAERRRLNDVTASLVAATLNGSREDEVENAGAISASSRLRAKRAIEARLNLPNIEINAIARAAGVSRASLYRLFESYGGVRTYIRRRRLFKCLRDLTRAVHATRSISEIAYDHGFTSEAHFSRTFKREFGLTPSEARQGGNDGAAVRREILADPLVGDRDYEHWIAEALHY